MDSKVRSLSHVGSLSSLNWLPLALTARLAHSLSKFRVSLTHPKSRTDETKIVCVFYWHMSCHAWYEGQSGVPSTNSVLSTETSASVGYGSHCVRQWPVLLCCTGAMFPSTSTTLSLFYHLRWRNSRGLGQSSLMQLQQQHLKELAWWLGLCDFSQH